QGREGVLQILGACTHEHGKPRVAKQVFQPSQRARRGGAEYQSEFVLMMFPDDGGTQRHLPDAGITPLLALWTQVSRVTLTTTSRWLELPFAGPSRYSSSAEEIDTPLARLKARIRSLKCAS